MHTNITPLNEALYDYLISVSLRDQPLFAQLRQETAKLAAAGMQMTPDSAQFLAFLVKLIGAKRTLEIGVFTGYSSLLVADALPPDGQIIACDLSPEYTAVARRYWREAGVEAKIDLRLGPAGDTLQQLIAAGQQGQFDFAFIDADKANYALYVECCLQLVRRGGLIAIDNTLWHGQLIDERVQDRDTQAIRDLNARLHTDERVDLTLVPIGDGLSLLRIR
jgi:predicted O-methyltransferase YrrM